VGYTVYNVSEDACPLRCTPWVLRKTETGITLRLGGAWFRYSHEEHLTPRSVAEWEGSREGANAPQLIIETAP